MHLQINLFTNLYYDWSIIEQINTLYAEIFIIFEITHWLYNDNILKTDDH